MKYYKRWRYYKILKCKETGKLFIAVPGWNTECHCICGKKSQPYIDRHIALVDIIKAESERAALELAESREKGG